MAYRNHDLNQHRSGSGGYDKLFHQNTGANNTNFKKKVKGNERMLNYHLFTGQYEQKSPQQDLSEGGAFNGFNENARKNREQFNEYHNNPTKTVEKFNTAIDQMHMPFDMQRPIATRDQVKNHYADEHKSLYAHKKTNDYFNEHQFMPGKYSNPNADKPDFYSMQNDDTGGYEDFF